MTDAELRDAAWAELAQTTTGWTKIKGYPPDKLAATHWGKGKALLDQIGAVAPPPSEPGPIAGQGYKIVFEDDFDMLDRGVWRLGHWWEPESPANYVCANSVLSIINKPAERKQRDLQTWNYTVQGGYIEAKMRYTRDTDSWASPWLLSNWHIKGGDPCVTLDAELDIFESFHNSEKPLPDGTPAPYYRSGSFTLHYNTNGYCNKPDQFTSNWVNDTGIDLAGSWHVFSALWTQTNVTWYIDGKQMKSHATYDSSWQPMNLFLACYSHTFTRQVQADFDWVRVWQK